MNIPFVVVGGSWDGHSSWPCFDSSSKETGEMLAQELIGSGFRKIAVVTRATQLSNNRERVRSFLKVLNNHDIRVESEWLITKPEDCECTTEIETLLLSNNRPEAIFAGNFDIAEDVYRIAKKLNINVPRQLEIVSCDMTGNGLLLNEYPVTTVVQPLQKMGYDAASFLCAKLNGVEMKEQQVVLYDVQLIHGCTDRQPLVTRSLVKKRAVS